MSNEEYIKTGTLELYVMGALSPQEMQEVELRCAEHPELKRELEQIEAAMQQFAQAGKVHPAPQVKTTLLSTLNFSDEAKVVQMPHAQSIDSGKLISMNSTRMSWAAAASTILFVISAGTAYFFYDKNKRTEGELLALQGENTLMAQQKDAAQLTSFKQQKTIAALTNMGNSVITLGSVKPGVNAKAVIYWDSTSRTTYISTKGLPALVSEEQYQLWAIVDGQPVDMGMIVIDFTAQDLQQMKDISGAQAFAITIEPKGGSVNPTLEKMVVLGKVGA